MSNAKGEIGFYCERVCLMCQNGLEDTTHILKNVILLLKFGRDYFSSAMVQRHEGLDFNI